MFFGRLQDKNERSKKKKQETEKQLFFRFIDCCNGCSNWKWVLWKNTLGILVISINRMKSWDKWYVKRSARNKIPSRGADCNT